MAPKSGKIVKGKNDKPKPTLLKSKSNQQLEGSPSPSGTGEDEDASIMSARPKRGSYYPKKTSNPIEAEDLPERKKPRTAFMIFSDVYLRSAVKASKDDGNVGRSIMGDARKTIGRQWKKAQADEKARFETQAAEEKAEYEEEASAARLAALVVQLETAAKRSRLSRRRPRSRSRAALELVTRSVSQVRKAVEELSAPTCTSGCNSACYNMGEQCCSQSGTKDDELEAPTCTTGCNSACYNLEDLKEAASAPAIQHPLHAGTSQDLLHFHLNGPPPNLGFEGGLQQPCELDRDLELPEAPAPGLRAASSSPGAISPWKPTAAEAVEGHEQPLSKTSMITRYFSITQQVKHVCDWAQTAQWIARPKQHQEYSLPAPATPAQVFRCEASTPLSEGFRATN